MIHQKAFLILVELMLSFLLVVDVYAQQQTEKEKVTTKNLHNF